MLSAFLGIQGGLQSDEFELLQHLFVEGMDLANAAARMKLSDRRARQMVARVGQKFREGLRSRTTPRHSDRLRSNESKKEVDAMATPGHKSKQEKEQAIVAALRMLKETPTLRRDAEGKLQVQLAELGDTWFEVSQIKDIIPVDLARSLDQSNVLIGWLFAPETPPTAPPLTEDRARWLEQLQAARTTSWISAGILWHFLSRELSEQDAFVAEEQDASVPEDATTQGQREGPVALIHSTLGSLSHAIEARLPWELRRKSQPRFRIDRQEDNRALGLWVGDPAGNPLDLAPLLKTRGHLLGDLTERGLEGLAAVFVRELFKGEITLPGFNRVDELGERTVWLELRSRLNTAALGEAAAVASSQTAGD
jgi:hypothetical protein